MNEMQFFQFTLTFTDMNACNFFWIKKTRPLKLHSLMNSYSFFVFFVDILGFYMMFNITCSLFSFSFKCHMPERKQHRGSECQVNYNL